MRICFFLGDLTSNGGIGRVSSVLANTLVNKENMEIFVLVYADSHKPLFYRLDERIHMDILFSELLSMKQAVFKNIIGKLMTYFVRNKIDIVLACGSLFFPAAAYACKHIATKCICWDHTGPQVTTDHAYQAWSRKFGAKHSDINVLLTKKAKAFYDEQYCKPEKNMVLYNPIDPAAVTKRKMYSASSQRIITVGRLTYQKNMELLIEVAAYVLKRNPGWTWDIYGDGELREKLQDLIIENGLQDVLTLKGQVSDIYERYGEYAFNVLTSRYEGFPMTLLEASANGLPMVSFDIETGPNEIIENGVNGFLVPPADKDAMQQAIETLIRDNEMRLSMSQESLKCSKHFQIGEIVEQWGLLFKKMM